ncbi:MAG: hypothetical protein ABI852_19355 [Gemmatimonadaceae bacterium]
MHQQSTRQLQECFTSLAPAAVLEQAVLFFSRQSGVYAAFPEKRGPTHVMLRGLGGEEIAIAAWPSDGVTRVSGSSYMFDQQVVRFLDALPPATPIVPPVVVPPAVTA